MSRPADLNPPQLQAVRTVDGPLLVLAGAGTGKTRVITHRIAHLLRHGIAPESILAVTFTNKAAREMRERVAALVQPGIARRLTLGTFHAFCARVLRAHISRLGYSPRFEIAAESYQSGLVKMLVGELGYAGVEGIDADAIRARISLAKNALQEPADILAAAADRRDEALGRVYELYQLRMKNMDLLDFDDLLVLVLRLWQKHPDILEQHRERWRYLLVDEYQDTNRVQFQIVATLAGPRANLCVVGDDDQSIYGWRGASMENILHFGEHFPGATVIRLEQNYRSTSTILEAANGLIAHNPARHPKTLWSALGRGELLREVRLHDEEEEAKIVGEIVRDLQLGERRPYEDCAVLYRSNHQSRAFEQSLRQQRVPYTLVGARSFYERKEILDAVSLIQCAWNPRDDLALLRVLNVPPRGLGDKAVERLRDLQRVTGMPFRDLLADNHFLKDLPEGARQAVRQFQGCLADYQARFHAGGAGLADAVGAFLRDVGYRDGLGRMYKPREDALNRLENVNEFLNAVAEFERSRGGEHPTLGDFLERFLLMDDNDRDEQSDSRERGVSLMTVHAAKGLEFPVVIVAGMEHGLFPHQQALEELRLDEERRLFYVAVTRARERLYLTHAEQRRHRGAPQRRRPSSFLAELPAELVSQHTAADLFTPASREEAAGHIAAMRAMFAKPPAPGTPPPAAAS
jgi:superfamily I DNA/RNA helicase